MTQVTFKPCNPSLATGTSFYNVEIGGSLARLVSLFGEPAETGGEGDKVKHEWVFKGSDGTIATVYDYKYDGAIEEYWHVGGRDKISCVKFVEWFNSL